MPSKIEDPAPRAAGRASNVFSSAGEQPEDTQRHRRIQAAEAACQASSSPTIASVCNDLRVEAIVHPLAFDESYASRGVEAAWRGDSPKSNPHLQLALEPAVTLRGPPQSYTAIASSLLSIPGALRTLRPYQERGHQKLKESIRRGRRRVMHQAPTGSGKTELAAHIIAGALRKGKRAAFIVPKLNLIDQTVASFEAQGIRAVGVMQGAHERTDPTQPVQVVSAQTLSRRSRPDVDIVIVDEAHELHKSVLSWLADPACSHVVFIGLSATPWSRGLGRFYDDLIISSTTAELIQGGYLCDFITFAPSDPDLSRVPVVAGDFHQGELAVAMDRPVLVGDVIETWLKRGENLQTLCFCVNRNHAKHMTERFLEVGVAAEYMDGHTRRESRLAIFDRYRAGETRIICNVGVLTIGIDLDVRCIIDAKPTKSPILFVQTIGRGLRPANGKDKLIILDHAGNHLRLGKVTDIGQDYLDDGTRQQRSNKEARKHTGPLLRLCDDCKAVLPRAASACPGCGAPTFSGTTIQAADGELVELGSRASGRKEPTSAEKAQFLAELKALQKPGWKPGWAAAKFKERFGHWPSPQIAGVLPAPASLKMRNWVKSRSIAWAMRRAHG
jgi:DNA repair protein RadD